MTAPDPVAIVDRGGTMTRAELRARVHRLRGALEARGVGRGDAVLLVTSNERESVAAYHAVVGCGAVAVLSHVSAGASELGVACEAAAPALAVLSPPAAHLYDQLPGHIPVVASDELDGEPSAAASDADPDAPRTVVFTSGTTSVPKGVVHSARSLRSAVASLRVMTAVGADDRVFLVSPLGSITGVIQALELAPAVGAAAVLEQAWDDEGSLDLLTETGATFYGGPDVVLDRLLAAAERRGAGVPLRIAALGGTMLRRELIETAESFGISVVRVYGSSEAPCSTGTRRDEPEELRLRHEGLPGPGVELRLADDGSGELLVRGPHLFGGYLDPTGSEAAWADGWFRTGDAAEIVDGRLRIVGRLKDVASRNGRKVSLAEVDQAFTSASGVVDCAAFAVPDPRTGERVAIAVRLEDGEDLDVPAVLAGMQAAGLARWKLPEAVVRVDGTLPVTATGKVQRRELAEEGEVLWRAERLARPSAVEHFDG